MAPTGLHGWIRSNDGRSAGLFVLFLLAIQLIAPLALAVPLIVLDGAHAPFADWTGYALRWAPLVLVGSIAWFAAQLWWHVETVKKAVGFRFVDGDDEPRLCRIIEPLIILAGLPPPFVGVIESDARNAFACGVGRKKAVVVVTRGLIDALSDAELAAVLAHELSHIRNGDIRLMAAANIFMATLSALHARNILRFTPVHGLASLTVPALLPLSIAASVIGRLGLRAGQVTRLLIASSREFIADAQAAEWTKDPGALAAALLKVDGRHRIAHARAEDDAMMIAGESEGTGATHPTVAQRVAALARVTGSMVWNAPASPADADWTASTPKAAVERLAAGRARIAAHAIARVRQGDDQNALGLTFAGTVALVMTVGAFVGLHWDETADPRALLARFDPRPLVAGPQRLRDTMDRSAETFGRGLAAEHRDRPPAPDRMERYRGQSGRMAPVTVGRSGDGLYRFGGRETHNRPEALVIAETERLGCFVADAKPMEAKGPLPMGPDGPTQDKIAEIRADIGRVAHETRSPLDWAGAAYYLDRREVQTDEAWMYYGQPGLAMARDAFAGVEERAALDTVRRMAAAAPIPGDWPPIRRAKLRALLRDPEAFVPCRSLAAGAPAR